MRKINAEAVKSLPNVTFYLVKAALRLAEREAELEAARKKLDEEKANLFFRLVDGWGYSDLRKAGVL